MELSFNLHGYTIVIGFRREKSRYIAMTGKEEQVFPGYESQGICKKTKIKRRWWRILQRAKDANAAKLIQWSGTGAGNNSTVGQPAEALRNESMQLFELAHNALSEIRPGIRAAGEKKLGRAELLLSLRRLLKNYRAFSAGRAFPFRVAIDNVILSDTAMHCSIHLNHDELQYVWRSER